MIEAKVIKDSISTSGYRLTTMELTYPRYIHAEFMTHRVFSRNAASSRAIPAKRFRKQVLEQPVVPLQWGSNKPGMQAGEELTGWRKLAARALWRVAALCALTLNWGLEKVGLHKQVANRILEPFFHIKVIVTATDWDNFFALRTHPAAQPEIQELACKMLAAMNTSSPRVLHEGEWHLPYVTDQEIKKYGLETAKQLSVARCARVSFLNHDGTKPNIPGDQSLYQKLLGNTPAHASPTEHQATPYNPNSAVFFPSNFRGWNQLRKTLPNEVVRRFPALVYK